MRNNLLWNASKLNNDRKQRKWWQRAVRIMAIAVVFCTTYALILPAITMDTDAVCGMEPHVHDAGCYESRVLHTFLCARDTDTVMLHRHDSFCYDEEENLICPLPEITEHVHDDACCAPVTVLLCKENHVHEAHCFEEHLEYICGMTEIVPHAHEADCYDAAGNMICGLPQVVVHDHTDDCRQVSEPVEILICGLPEHIHVDACFPLEEDEQQPVYLCGSGIHTHIDSCFDAEGKSVCSIPEHTHEAACLVEDLDLNADVETREQWEQTLANVELTGNWPGDVLAVAATQLGYSESEKNAVLENDRLMGYTRYGQWYGLPYGDWCAMYASFVLHYAEVEDYPLESSVTRWIEVLTERGLYYTAADYGTKPGDLVFFDYEQRQAAQEGAPDLPVEADHVGFVAELIPASEGSPAKLVTLEGNVEGKVMYVTYDLNDPAIIGYGRVPAGRTIVLEYPGEDFRIQVSFGLDAGIPETAQLTVREILPGTEEYNTYYQQSVEAMLLSATVGTEEELAVSFARFFDIGFLADGQAIEPAAPVNVQISYNDRIPRTDAESGVAVHFAADGVEVLDAQTSQSAEDTLENIDTFEFEQSSFSVVGTVLSAYQRAIATSATKVQPYQIENTGAVLYVLYTQINGQYYALDGNGYAVPITVSGNNITLSGSATDDLFWSFVAGSGNYYYTQIRNLGTSRYLHPYNNGGSNTGTTTSNPYGTTLVVSGDSFKIRGANNNYLYFANAGSRSAATTNSNTANSFYVAEVGQILNVWFDGTNGGMMSYYGADNLNRPVIKPGSGTVEVELPETWKSTPKYPYVLKGWYDINSHTYYPVDPNDSVVPTATLSDSTVFYADWISASYDVGQNNEHVVESVDTSDFITSYVFDYGVLFNAMSLTHTGSISANSHSETWTIVNNGKVPYKNDNTLGFVFVDYDANGDISYANGRDNTNINQGDAITAGIINEVYHASGGKDLLDLLFNPGTDVIGKHYVGTGNYLFQYMDSTTENYDGIHDGYYYLDARLNAASYNQTDERFYLYDYLERTSDSDKDGGVGQYSDILPFNSPYIFGEDDDYTGDGNRRVDYYEDTIRRPGWEYDAKDGASSYQDYNSTGDATTNYFFGIRTDIEFFLPNNAGTTDEHGNYGNISTRGEHMIFDFHGDDDVWVYIDGELVLDIGGLHGVMFGQIDFSTGTVITGKDGGTTTTRTFQELLGHNITEGTHSMSVYYMERGSSQSNCAIYFNIAPRYDLEITKEDVFTADKLDGAVFSVFNDEAMTSPAQLWPSKAAHDADMIDGTADEATNQFTVVDGVAKCWGISAGKTYYIYETSPPLDYPPSDDMIRITLNNRGTATIETTALHGPNGEATEGFAVIKQNVNDTLKVVALTVTNQKEGETTEVRVQKTWAEGSTNLPESITVYLYADGELVGRTATLTAKNGWAYTWKGLPKYRDEGIDEEVVYVVQEVLVPDYVTTQGETEKVEKYTQWNQVAQMSDSETYLLVHNGQALSYNGSFSWISPDAAKQDSGKAAQWSVTTDHDGFHLKNGLGYVLTYGSGGFYGTASEEATLNQVIYYLNSRLVVHDHDVYYQFGANGAVVKEDGLAFTLYQKETITGFLTGITNTPVEEENQTYVEVNKLWKDGAENHTADKVVIRLFADGVFTGRTVILSADNGWKDGFYDLPYHKADGTTVIQYTVDEVPITGYIPTYSDPAVLPGLPVTVWKPATALAVNGIYQLTGGSNALTVQTDNSVTGAHSDTSKTNQQWKAVDKYGNVALQNVATGRYLTINGSVLSTTGSLWSAATVTVAGGKLKVGSLYLEVGSGYAQGTNNTANIISQKVLQQVNTTGMPGAGYTVTNLPSITELPNTGGMGTSLHTYGGLLLMAAAAAIYVIYNGRKRKKGGAYN